MDYGPEICIIETLLFLLAQQDQESIGLVRDFAVTLTVAGAALVLFRRIKLPPVLGYLLAGVIVGPFTFAGINFGPFTDLRGPVQNLGTIRLLADLGLVFLLFGIGLEIGWQRIRQIGLRVIIIGFVEMTTMFVLGYEIAYLLGWTPLEQVFLGAALSISSSAILIKMLRDTGTLFDPQGRIIVGVLLVEDFVAVIMLTVLSGIATTGGANIGDIGALAAKLAIFGTAALAFGALLAPRLIRYIARFESEEVTLITSLALCFSLALAGYELGLSAAAGAFVIGMVLGDTEHSEDISRVMSPLRDMFAALFFVSIGMLMDIFTVVEFLVPALIISAVFILGKVVSDTTGAILSGHDGRTSLRVGMSMPQIGEFSLAMIKTGVENGAVSAFISPVITVATAITALFYPLIFHSHARVANFIDRISPLWLKEYANVLFLWLTASRRAFHFKHPIGPPNQAFGAIHPAQHGNHRGHNYPGHGGIAVQRLSVGVDKRGRRTGRTNHRRVGAGPVHPLRGGGLAEPEAAYRVSDESGAAPVDRIAQSQGTTEPAGGAAQQHPDSHSHPADHLERPLCSPAAVPGQCGDAHSGADIDWCNRRRGPGRLSDTRHPGRYLSAHLPGRRPLRSEPAGAGLSLRGLASPFRHRRARGTSR